MKFELLWKDVQNKAANLCINLPKLPRKKRAPPTIEEYLRGNAAPEFDNSLLTTGKSIYLSICLSIYLYTYIHIYLDYYIIAHVY